ncbi:hypothetical protein PybrP1_006361 [[Pythium] brassicae (nom. inval.)]|nr:hypothetical protein PybrP1_006361 [[Pythium] brassicae (nom. inval.)]
MRGQQQFDAIAVPQHVPLEQHTPALKEAPGLVVRAVRVHTVDLARVLGAGRPPLELTRRREQPQQLPNVLVRHVRVEEPDAGPDVRDVRTGRSRVRRHRRSGWEGDVAKVERADEEAQRRTGERYPTTLNEHCVGHCTASPIKTHRRKRCVSEPNCSAPGSQPDDCETHAASRPPWSSRGSSGALPRAPRGTGARRRSGGAS